MTITLSQFERTFIENYIAKQSTMGFAVGKILSQDGIVQKVREWASDASAWVWGFSNPGMMGFSDYENAGDIAKTPTEKTAKLLSIAGKLVLRPSEITQARDNSLGIKKGLQEILSAHMLDFQRQVEGMKCCGDASKWQAAGDPIGQTSGNSVYPGLLNGTDGTHRTVIAAGTGGDDNVTAFGDFLDTYALAEKTMVSEGIDTSRVHVIMNAATLAVLKKSRSTNDVPEIVMLKDAYPSWTLDVSDHIQEKESDDVYTDRHFIHFIAPFDVNGEPLIKLYESKELHVQPLYNGGLSGNGTYDWLYGWKGGIIAKNEHAVVSTGVLTIA